MAETTENGKVYPGSISLTIAMVAEHVDSRDGLITLLAVLSHRLAHVSLLLNRTRAELGLKEIPYSGDDA